MVQKEETFEKQNFVHRQTEEVGPGAKVQVLSSTQNFFFGNSEVCPS